MNLRIAAFSAVDMSLPQGHALHLRGLLDALAARGHDVTLVTPWPEGAIPSTRFRAEPVPILRWRVLGPWSFELLGGLRLAFRVHRLRAHAIYARQDLYSWAPAAVAGLLRKPLIVEVNASIPDEMALWGPPLARWLARRSERLMLRRATAIVTLGAGLADTLAARTGVGRDRFHVVPIATHLPAPADPEGERARQAAPPGRFIVAFAGNLRPIQGIETLIDAVARVGLSDVELWIVGAGSIERSLRERAGTGAVRFFGGVAREEADRLLACAQLLVAPYLRDAYDRTAGDAISTKVLTYLACDRPVLISDMPYYRWIEEIGAGECFPSGDAAALAERIAGWRARWVDAGRPLRDWPWARPGPGRRFVERGRTWDAAAAEIEEISKKAVTSSGRRGR
jgi:phosphatidylinositol alpha-mannosyltransferase